MTDEDLLWFFNGGEWYLGNEPGFDPWEQETGKVQVSINGMTALVWIDAQEPSCSCCHGCKPSYIWTVRIS